MIAAFLAGTAFGAAGFGLWNMYQRRREGKLLSFVTHELITPLTSLNMTVLNFFNGVFGPIAQDHKSWMIIIKEQSNWLNVMIGDLRDVVHLRFHNDFKLFLEPIDLLEMVKDSLSNMQGSITRTGLSVKIEGKPGLPPVWGDRERLQRMTANLLAHAKKFQIKGSVSIVLSPVGGGVELLMTYTGPAVKQEEAARMLDLFYPVGPENSEVLPCVGLGLGMCRLIAERHGGSLDFTVDAQGVSRVRAVLPGKAS